MTRKQLILKLLIDTRLNGSPFLLHDDIDTQRRVWISGGFRPMYWFRGKGRGGDAADIRLRELRREHFVPIEMRRHKWKYWDIQKSVEINKSTPIYRLAMTPKEIWDYDWDPAWEIPFTWRFQRKNGRAVLIPMKINESRDGQFVFV